MILYTIGYENHTAISLLTKLADLGVYYLADIRDWPYSRREGFSPGDLAVECNHRGLEYMPYRSLGVPHDLRIKGRKYGLESIGDEYLALLKQHDKQFASLVNLISGDTGPVCLMCYEWRHFTCHRSLLAELLAEHIPGLEVQHLSSLKQEGKCL